MRREIIYYQDELNDEFSTAKINPIKIDKNYEYSKKGILYKISCFFYYRIIALPLATIYCKLCLHHHVVNKKVLKPYKKQGLFLYGNHTQIIADGLLPTLMTFPRKVSIIVHPNNVSIKGLKRATPRMGAMPLPDDLEGAKNFLKEIKKRISEHQIITIYPEAHIWPYYTKIRPFKSNSFNYPIKYNTPVFCFTNTYQKRRHSEKPKIVTYIDGPFFPKEELSLKENEVYLRNLVYDKMVERSKKSNVIYIEYRKKGETYD